MKTVLYAVMAAFLMIGPSMAADEVELFIGTYTSPTSGSKGIYRATLNTKTGELSTPTLAAEAKSPSFLAVHPTGKYVYAVLEEGGGKCSSYAVEKDGKLKHLNTQDVGGSGPCHVWVDPAGKTVLTACYGDGTITSLLVNVDGAVSKPITIFKNSGTGPDKSRQEGPHGHAVYTDASGKFAYSCDLGTDEVLVFKLDGDKGTLTLAEPRSAKVPPGGGPRHLALHPNGKFAFVNNEMTLTVTAFARNPENGALKEIHTLSTLPADDQSTKNRSTAEIFCHPSGKYVYVSNRGHDSIAAYSIADDGKLTLLEIEKCGVAVPRGFGIDPTGNWLVVGGQDSNDLTVMKIDPATGKLSPGTSKVKCGAPVCVVFNK